MSTCNFCRSFVPEGMIHCPSCGASPGEKPGGEHEGSEEAHEPLHSHAESRREGSYRPVTPSGGKAGFQMSDMLTDETKATIGVGVLIVAGVAGLMALGSHLKESGQRNEAAFIKSRPGWVRNSNLEDFEQGVRPSDPEIAWILDGAAGKETERLKGQTKLSFGAYLYTDGDGRKRRTAVLAEDCSAELLGGVNAFMPPFEMHKGYTQAIVTVEDAIVTGRAVTGMEWHGSLGAKITLGAKTYPQGTPVTGEIFLADDSYATPHGALGVRVLQIGDVAVSSEPYVVQKDPASLAAAAHEARAYVEAGANRTMAKGAASGAILGAVLSSKDNRGSSMASGAAMGALLADLETSARVSVAEQSARSATPVTLLPGQAIRLQVKPN